MRAKCKGLLVFAALVAAACATRPGAVSGSLHRWWANLGPVLPHDSFPADCKTCHLGDGWDSLREDFSFDHEQETGEKLVGAHSQALCLRCHNDRGPVEVFARQGCLGCHEDYHTAELGPNCTKCHTQQTWAPYGQIEMHNRTRFPLTGAHLLTACYQCHPGARVGNFVPTDSQCLSCHRSDLNRANNPPHLQLGYTNNCDRCHIATSWNQATVR